MMGQVIAFPRPRVARQTLCFVCGLVWLIVAPLAAVAGWYGVWHVLAVLWHWMR